MKFRFPTIAQVKKSLKDPYVVFMTVMAIIIVIMLSMLMREAYIYGTLSIRKDGVAKISNAYHGEHLYDFIMGTAYDEFETSGTFTTDDDRILEWTDHDPEQVALPGSISLYLSTHYDEIIVAHNHPNVMTCHSDADLISFAQAANKVESIVATENFAFHIKKDAGQTISAKESKEFLDEVNALHDAGLIPENGYSCYDANGEFHYASTITTELYAEHFGFEFWMEPIRGETYNRYEGDQFTTHYVDPAKEQQAIEVKEESILDDFWLSIESEFSRDLTNESERVDSNGTRHTLADEFERANSDPTETHHTLGDEFSDNFSQNSYVIPNLSQNSNHE